jgi:hypothetical protein
MDNTEEASLPETVKPRRLKAGKQVTIKEFAPSFKVVLPDMTTVDVPVDKISSDAQRSVLVARARIFLEDQMDKLDDKTLTPQEIKDVIKAVSDLDALQREQFVTSLNNGKSSALGAGLQGVIRDAARGAAEGTANGFLDKMKDMDKAASKADKAKPVIEVQTC